MPKTGTTLLFRRGGIGGGDTGATRAKEKKIRLPIGRLAKADATATTVVSSLQLCAMAVAAAAAAAAAASAGLVWTDKNDLRNRTRDGRPE